MPPLVNRYYMIDLVPRQSLVKWLVDEGRTVFVISWVNPGAELKDKDVGDYVLEGIVEAIGEVRKRTGSAPDLFSFCLGGTLAAIALAWLAAKGRANEVNSATLIGSLVDFSDMRDWSAFVHEGHLGALEEHLEAQGYADSLELQRLFAAMRANDLIWSSVVNHYLLDRPPRRPTCSTGSRTARASPPPSSRATTATCCSNNKLKEPAGFKVGDVADRPRRDRDADAGDRAQGRSRLGVGGGLCRARGISAPTSSSADLATMPASINPPGREQARLSGPTTSSPPTRRSGSTRATRHEGSWWPWWTKWLGEQGQRQDGCGARKPKDPIEPAPGRYAMMP